MNNLIPVVLITVGATLLWASITNKDPVDAVRSALTGEDMSNVETIVEPASTSGDPSIVTPDSPGDGRRSTNGEGTVSV